MLSPFQHGLSVSLILFFHSLTPENENRERLDAPLTGF